MRRKVLLLVCLGLAGCAPRLVWEPVERVALPKGLEIRWAGARAQAPGPLILQVRCVGEGPTALLRLLRADEGEEVVGEEFVRRPQPGQFRYDADSDCLVAEQDGGTPFSLAHAFRWYDLVLHPGGEVVTIDLGLVEPGSTVRVLVEYVPLSYRRLARAAYVAPEGAQTTESASEETELGVSAVRFGRLSEEELRRRRPRRLFLRSGFLPAAIKVPLEIPWGPPP